MGYHRAGFEVVGVDIKSQPHYPFRFEQADALTFPLWGFEVIHASPPCQAHTDLKVMWNAREHRDLVTPTRRLLEKSGVPWVIENVPRAPMRPDAILCGSAFGLGAGPYQLRRHRWFEFSSFFAISPPCRHQSPTIGIYGDHVRKARRQGDLLMGEGFPLAQEAMGIDWMTWGELREAIPPAYTEWIGHQLLASLRAAA